MEIFQQGALFLHLIGFAYLFGVSVIQIRSTEYVAKSGMLHGALLQLLTGIALVGTMGANVNHLAAGLKLIILLVIVLFLVYYRRKERGILPREAFWGILALILLEVLIAILWIEVK